mmetsp:Transcript_21443/g.49929  ORF Transcript_21443/g.49929 Transcript_21443/m.49929 type:complete len:212 (-) Transcript_21443:892-1527(-)
MPILCGLLSFVVDDTILWSFPLGQCTTRCAAQWTILQVSMIARRSTWRAIIVLHAAPPSTSCLFCNCSLLCRPHPRTSASPHSLDVLDALCSLQLQLLVSPPAKDLLSFSSEPLPLFIPTPRPLDDDCSIVHLRLPPSYLRGDLLPFAGLFEITALHIAPPRFLNPQGSSLSSASHFHGLPAGIHALRQGGLLFVASCRHAGNGFGVHRHL